VLDPFCGTGTTLVECKKQGIPSVGIEANPVLAFASQVKDDWTADPIGPSHYVRRACRMALPRLEARGMITGRARQAGCRHEARVAQ
jgi:hypothetical protein